MESPSEDLVELIDRIIKNKLDENCVLCLSKISLIDMTNVLLLKDATVEYRVPIKELMTPLQLSEDSNETSLTKICSKCVVQISDFFLFKKRSTNVKKAFANISTIVRKKINDINYNTDTTQNTIWIPYNNIIDYANLNTLPPTDKEIIIEDSEPERDTTVKKRNCLECARDILENDQMIVIADNSHLCNICNLAFETHKETVDHAKLHYGIADLTAGGIMKIESGFSCIQCQISNLTWCTYKTHVDRHKLERVSELLVRGGEVCCVCLEHSGRLRSAASRVQRDAHCTTLAQILCRLQGVPELNREQPALVCDSCCERAIAAHTLLTDYDTSSRVLDVCLTQLLEAIDKGKSVTSSLSIKFIDDLENIYDSVPAVSEELSSPEKVTAGSENVAPLNETVVYRCLKCRETFKTVEARNIHAESHSKSDLYRCNICCRRFKTSLRMMHHEETFHSKRTVKIVDIPKPQKARKYYSRLKLCETCKRYVTKYRHNCPLSCEECLVKDCIHKKYLDHYTKNLDLPYSEAICMDCNFHYQQNKITYISHVNYAHIDKYASLQSQAQTSFTKSRVGLKQRSSADATLAKAHLCQNCKEIFSSVSELLNHMVVCALRNINFSCDICNSMFAQKSEYLDHCKVHQTKQFLVSSKGISISKNVNRGPVKYENNNVFCAICGIMLQNLNVRNHMRWHLVAKSKIRTFHPLFCDYCNFSFRLKSDLELHINKQHLNRKLYDCKYCSKKFYSLKARTSHYKSHDEWRSKCDVCDKEFKTPVGLQLHMRNHLGEKRYACNVCKKTFISGSLLGNHRRRKHSQPTHECHTCGKRFFYGNDLKKHELIHSAADQRKQ